MHAARVKREMEQLEKCPPVGVSIWPVNDSLSNFRAKIIGPSKTPYENGVFELDIILGQRYPIEPPQVSFITRIYHPNIDEQGRICLDSLKQTAKNGWMPYMTLYSLFNQLILLLKHPNPQDPLVVEIADEYLKEPLRYASKARAYTDKYAKN